MERRSVSLDTVWCLKSEVFRWPPQLEASLLSNQVASPAMSECGTSRHPLHFRAVVAFSAKRTSGRVGLYNL
jgi:hypothetical protein